MDERLYSRPLDVHRISEFPEVQRMITYLFNEMKLHKVANWRTSFNVLEVSFSGINDVLSVHSLACGGFCQIEII